MFKNYGERYDSEAFTRGTRGEVDFLEREIGCDKSKRILDVGCGTGRHSLELSRRGYDVVGIDLSRSMLNKARETALREKLGSVQFIECDARNMWFEEEFDLAVCLCEGAFSLMETDEENFQILRSISRALKKNGKLILTAPSAIYSLTHWTDGEFDIVTLRERFKLETVDDAGNTKIIDCEDRHYTYTEVRWMLEQLGFSRIEFFGHKLGEFSRDRKPSKEDYEMLVVAVK